MRTIVRAATAGITLGALTSFGQTYLPEPVKQFANSYSVWLLAAFAVGMFAARRTPALWGGAAVELAALIGYNLVTAVRFNPGYGSRSVLLMWFMGGLIGGPLLGLAGHEYGVRSTYRLLALLGMMAVILSEAAYMFGILHYTAKGICFVVLALVFLGIALPNANNRVK